MWSNAGLSGGDVWGGNLPNSASYTNAAWGESIEETLELKKKLQQSKAENADLQRQIIQFEVQLLTAQVVDADVDSSDIPKIIAELGRQNQELKQGAKKEHERNDAQKEEIAALRQQLTDGVSPAMHKKEESSTQIDQLQKYIRSQAKEYIEGKAEWSKQLAEMKRELEQQVSTLRREKMEAERHHESEIQLLQIRSNRVAGEGAETPEDLERYCEDLRIKLEQAQVRVDELEAYIRGNAASAPNSMREVLIHTSFDLKRSESEFAALQKLHQQTVEFWKQSCSRLISALEKHVQGQTLDIRVEQMLQSLSTSSSSGDEVMTLASSLASGCDELNVVYAAAVDLQRFLLASEKREVCRTTKSGSALNFIAEVAMNGTPDMLGRHAILQKNLDELKLFRKEIACTVMKIEKSMRSQIKDLRPVVSDLLAVEPLAKYDMSLEAIIGEALSESSLVLPLDENKQRKALCTLRRMEYLSGSLCTAFVALPEQLKVLFDLTKKLVSQDEVNNLLLDVQEIQRSAKTAEHRHRFHVSLLEKRFEAMSKRCSRIRSAKLLGYRRVNSDPGVGSEDCSDEIASANGTDDARAEIRSILKQPNGLDELVKLRTEGKHQADMVQELMARLDKLEQHIVDLHISRYHERHQHMDMSAMMRQQSLPVHWPPQPEQPQRRRNRNSRGSQVGALKRSQRRP